MMAFQNTPGPTSDDAKTSDPRDAIRDAIRALQRVERVTAVLLPSDLPLMSLADRAALVHRARARRARLFEDACLFGEADYDILLDLYVQRAKHYRVSVSSACLASGVPQTTALRHIAKLEDVGLVQRSGDTMDARRTYLSLTDRAVERIELHLLDLTAA